MLFGVPVIANNVGGIPEIINDGVSGVLLNSRDPSNIAKSVIGLLGAPEKCRMYASKARQEAERRFDMRRTARGIEKILHEAAAGSERRGA